MDQQTPEERDLYDYPDMGGVFGHVAYEHYVDDPRSGCNGCVALRKELRETRDKAREAGEQQ